MERLRKLLVLAAVLLCFTIKATLVPIGSPASPIAGAKLLQAPTNATLDLQSFRGKVVVLDFWATWCGPCIQAMPHWNQLVDTFKDKPVQFIAVTDEQADVVAAFLKRNPIHSWVSTDDLSHSTRDTYGIEAIPTTIIINQRGKVVGIAHPLSIEPKDIDEVLQTGKSSLPAPKNQNASDLQNPTNAITVALQQPLFELYVRKSDPHPGGGHGVDCWSLRQDDGLITGQYASLRRALIYLFATRECLLDCRAKLPEDDYIYDFTVRLPGLAEEDRDKALCAMFHGTFGLKVHREHSDRDVFVMKLVSTNAPGLVPSTAKSKGGGGPESGGLKIGKAQLSQTTSLLEYSLHKPVIDETGVTNKFDIRLHWKMSPSELLPKRLGYGFIALLKKPDAKLEAKLSPDLHRLLDAYREVPQADLKILSADDLETISYLHIEMAKPEDRRFEPDPAAITAAVREQWGIALTPERRTMPIIVVEQ